MSNFIISAFSDEISSDLSVQMRVLREHGIRYTDIRGVDGKNISEYTPEEAKDIRARLDDGGISVACVGSPLGKIRITDPFEPHRELCEKLFSVASVLGTRFIRIFSFYIPEGDDPTAWRDEVLHRLNAMVDLAEQHNLVLLHENEKDIYGDTAERCLDLLRSLNRPSFRGIFDPANFVQCGEEPYPYAFELLRGYIDYIHIKDALRSDGTNVPAGTGDGCIPSILRALHREGYEGFLTLEPHLTTFDGLAGLELHLNQSFAEKKDDGEEKFAVAVKALQDILCKLD